MSPHPAKHWCSSFIGVTVEIQWEIFLAASARNSEEVKYFSIIDFRRTHWLSYRGCSPSHQEGTEGGGRAVYITVARKRDWEVQVLSKMDLQWYTMSDLLLPELSHLYLLAPPDNDIMPLICEGINPFIRSKPPWSCHLSKGHHIHPEAWFFLNIS